MRLLILFGLLLGAGSPAPVRAASGLPPLHVDAHRAYTAVLMWHDVVPDKKEVWFDTTIAELKAQFAAIQRRRFHVISLEALMKHLTVGAPVPPRPLVLTFDDNTLGLYTYAYPLLKQYHYPATFFVHTNYVGVTTVKEHCTWEQLLEMQQSGLVSVEGHTRSHPEDMRPLPEKRLDYEVACNVSIEKRLKVPVFAFSYPDGKYDARVASAVARAGYKIAVTEDWGSADASPNMMMVHRYSIHKRFAQALNDVERAWGREK